MQQHSQQLRRAWLQQTACGFGALAASALCQSTLANPPIGTTDRQSAASNPSGAHHPPKAKRVIFLFMQGGVSQVDSFDYKPLLAEKNGQSLEFNDSRQLAKQGKATQHRLMKSPWKFQQYGETGRWASELFPETARHMDDLTMLHAMHTEGIAHGPATLFLHCGSTNFIRPSMGSWVLYGLGNENQNLPGFISIAPSSGNGGPRNYGHAFLPAQFQGTRIGGAGSDELIVKNLLPRKDIAEADRQRQIEMLARLNAQQLERRNFKANELDAVIDSYEMAWKMQAVAPSLINLQQESAETLKLYGIDDPKTKSYGERCLLARRLCEAGVRFIQVNYGDNSANPAWDQHSNLPKHADHAKAVDRPIAGLLTDLKNRGLLEDTIVWWGGEFGRTPYAQDNGTGRDHNPGGFTVWLAGGGFKAGYTHGSTDEFGFQAIQDKVHMHDLHATILHQLGLDHKRLTFSFAGRGFRLTDVHGRIVDDIIA
jgi:Protein of unknown function (DUF1501)